MPAPNASALRSLPVRTGGGLSSARPRELLDSIYDRFIAVPFPTNDDEDHVMSPNEIQEAKNSAWLQVLVRIADEGGTNKWQEWEEEVVAYYKRDDENKEVSTDVQYSTYISEMIGNTGLTLQRVSRLYADDICTALKHTRHRTNWWFKYCMAREIPFQFGFPAAQYISNSLDGMTIPQLKAHKKACAAALRPKGPVETDYEATLYSAKLEGASGHGGPLSSGL